MKYKVGDRVVGIHNDTKDIKNIKGTVIVARNDTSICVEFDSNIGGHSNGGRGKDGCCWWLNGLKDVKKISESKNKNKIVITSDGVETLARLYEGNKVVKTATAKCSAEDTFDFSIGAKLAYDRLMREYKSGDKVKVIGNTCFHYANVGDIITLENEFGHDCRGRKAWHFEEKAGYIVEEDFEFVDTPNDKKKVKAKKVKKEKFVPHIEDTLTHYGNLGDPTNYKDAIGRPLFVGDTVELFDESNRLNGETPIVKARLEWNKGKEKAFVMGIEVSCDDEKGTIGEWKIIKKRSYEDVEDGEVVTCGLKYIKTEP